MNVYMIQEIIKHLRMLAEVLKRLARLLDAEVSDLELMLEEQDLEDRDLDNEAIDEEDDMYEDQIEEIVID